MYVHTLVKNLLIKFLMMLFLVAKECKFDSCGISGVTNDSTSWGPEGKVLKSTGMFGLIEFALGQVDAYLVHERRISWTLGPKHHALRIAGIISRVW